MQRVLNMVRNLQQALSNLTGLVVDERTVIGRRDAVPCYRYASPSSVEEEEEEEGEGEEEEETSQGEQEEGTLTGSRTGLVSRESSDTEETTGGHYLQSVSFVPWIVIINDHLIPIVKNFKMVVENRYLSPVLSMDFGQQSLVQQIEPSLLSRNDHEVLQRKNGVASYVIIVISLEG